MIEVPPPHPDAYTILADAGFVGEPFNPRQHRSCALVERYVVELAVDLLDALDVRALLREPRTVAAVLAMRGFVPSFARPLGWLLAMLAVAGVVTEDTGGYRVVQPERWTERDAVRAAVLDADASYAPTLALLDEAAAAYPRVARGETTGEHALVERVALWVAYFSNGNKYYALNNRVAAAAVEARLPARARVLEVGAGLGSATEALLDVAGDAIATYRLTEPVAFFRRRAERTIRTARPDLPLACATLDVNSSWATQGTAAASVDLVWGVNVFHLARDLDATLREAHATLAPGGWLVAGEGIRPVAGRPVTAELPFQLLDAFLDVELDPATRPTAGFLTAEQWLAAFARAGFVDVTLVPDVIGLRRVYPGFLAAAVCGRRT